MTTFTPLFRANATIASFPAYVPSRRSFDTKHKQTFVKYEQHVRSFAAQVTTEHKT